MNEVTCCQGLRAVRQRIQAAALAVGRDPGTIRLLAVSKTQDQARLREAIACGQLAFGENYAQEFLDKHAALAEWPLEWHFIGPLQANKTRVIAERAAWVHSLEREKIARRLDEQRPPELPPLNVCIQVNIDGQASKSGVGVADIEPLAATLTQLPRLRLRGLMAIPTPSQDPAAQRRPFAALRAAYEDLRRLGFELDTLSMGMSADLDAAVAEGATLLRIGSAIFGPRPPK